MVPAGQFYSLNIRTQTRHWCRYKFPCEYFGTICSEDVYTYIPLFSGGWFKRSPSHTICLRAQTSCNQCSWSERSYPCTRINLSLKICYYGSTKGNAVHEVGWFYACYWILGPIWSSGWPHARAHHVAVCTALLGLCLCAYRTHDGSVMANWTRGYAVCAPKFKTRSQRAFQN